MQDTKLSSLYTTDTNENAYEAHKLSSQEELKIKVMKSSRTSWRSLRHMHEFKKNRNMQLTTNLIWDSRLKQEIFGFYDFVIFFVLFSKIKWKKVSKFFMRIPGISAMLV